MDTKSRARQFSVTTLTLWLAGLLIIYSGVNLWRNWDYAPGNCGYYVTIKYKYPDSDDWTVPTWLGPYVDINVAEMRIKELTADPHGDEMVVNIVEDCVRPK